MIAESGEALKSPKIRVEVAKRLQLTAEDLAQMPPVSPTGVFKNRVAHALKNLQHYDFIVGRGIDGEGKRYRVTAAGRERDAESNRSQI